MGGVPRGVLLKVRREEQAKAQASIRKLAKDVLLLAADAGVPDTFWHTDRRIQRAVTALGTTTYAAQRWANWIEVENT